MGASRRKLHTFGEPIRSVSTPSSKSLTRIFRFAIAGQRLLTVRRPTIGCKPGSAEFPVFDMRHAGPVGWQSVATVCAPFRITRSAEFEVPMTSTRHKLVGSSNPAAQVAAPRQAPRRGMFRFPWMS
jgi:hypothetical protein